MVIPNKVMIAGHVIEMTDEMKNRLKEDGELLLTWQRTDEDDCILHTARLCLDDEGLFLGLIYPARKPARKEAT